MNRVRERETLTHSLTHSLATGRSTSHDSLFDTFSSIFAQITSLNHVQEELGLLCHAVVRRSPVVEVNCGMTLLDGLIFMM